MPSHKSAAAAERGFIRVTKITDTVEQQIIYGDDGVLVHNMNECILCVRIAPLIHKLGVIWTAMFSHTSRPISSRGKCP